MFKLQKIYVNPGSDCTSKALKVFPAFCAIGISPDVAHGSIVFTMNLTNLGEEVDYAFGAVAASGEEIALLLSGVRQENDGSLRRMSMKLSTRSRYGTRLMLDMAQHYNEGPIQLGDIAKPQEVSVKYLEQIILPLKKTPYVKSVRGPREATSWPDPRGDHGGGNRRTAGRRRQPGGVLGEAGQLRPDRKMHHPAYLVGGRPGHVCQAKLNYPGGPGENQPSRAPCGGIKI
jgi:hypothetical protein